MSSNAKKKNAKSSLLIWIEFIPFWILCQIIRLIPLRAAYAMARVLFRGLYHIDAKHRLRAVQHLLHAGVAKDRAEANRIARQTFDNFGMLLVEIFKADQCFRLEKLRATGSESAIREALKLGEGNRNVIIATAHYGNWELAGSGWATYTGIPLVSVMRPFGNPKIGECILRNRRGGVHEVVPKKGGIKPLLRALKDNKSIAVLVDQHASAKEGGEETVFFGQPCRTHSSPALLHLKTGVPIIPEITRRVDDQFNFEFVVGDLIKYQPTGDKEHDVKTVTQMYTSALEKLIRERPEQWMWAHRRWLNLNRETNAPPPQDAPDPPTPPST